MRKFNFRKLGILLAMMLVGGMVLVGPASAGQTMESYGPYDVYAIGNWISSSTDQFKVLGKVEETNGNYVGLNLKLEVSNTRLPFGPWYTSTSSNWQVSTGWKTYQDTQYRRDHDVKTTFSSSTGHSGDAVYTLDA